jgi:beta-lactamase regulating signal transducer with metallopeptidase domain
MMANEILRGLLAVSLTGGAVILLLCAARTHLRRAFGARLAYFAWSAVPATMIMTMLPMARVPSPVQQAVAPIRHLAGFNPTAIPPGAAQWSQWLVAVWLAIAVAMVIRLWRAHVQHGVIEGPAVVGLWRPVIALPDDFSMRYTPQEQHLILAHEAVHLSRRDPLMNCLCALMQCVLWFHPLVHLAARRFRLDQELACDAAVMHANPGLKRTYAEAMLKTQLSTQTAPVHCHWQSIHPLKERIMQLQQTPPSQLRRLLGRITVTAMVAACSYTAMAANAGAGSAEKYMVKMKLSTNGGSYSPALLLQEGVPATVVSKGDDGVWRTELIVTKASDTSVLVKTVIKHDDRVIGSPGLLVRIGDAAGVGVDNEFRLELAVSKPRD